MLWEVSDLVSGVTVALLPRPGGTGHRPLRRPAGALWRSVVAAAPVAVAGAIVAPVYLLTRALRWRRGG